MKKILFFLLIISISAKAQKPFTVQFDNSDFYFITYHQMDSVVEILHENPAATIAIIGHAHHRELGNSLTRQIILSQNRADIVKTYLRTRGIHAHRVTLCKGVGTEQPRDRTVPHINWRAEIFITQ